MTARLAGFSVLLAALSAFVTAPRAASRGGFDALAPDVVLNQVERARLRGGEPFVKVVASRDGFLTLTGIVRTEVTGERLLRWAASVEAVQKGRYVPQIGRFSSPPRLSDLNGLSIDRDDLDALARCRQGDCGVKLSAGEMGVMAAPRTPAERDLRFRHILVERARQFLAEGPPCVQPFHDHRDPVAPADVFEGLLQRLEFFQRTLPGYTEYLRTGAAAAVPVERSFLYWSKEDLGMKPIISITHFSAQRLDGPALPEAVVVARQVYASHYRNASVTVTALVNDGGQRYLVYLNRSHIDAFQGLFGGIVRRTVERRVRREAPGVMLNLRTRFESGEPPA